MPTYDYQCCGCGFVFEAARSVTSPKPRCPRCRGTVKTVILSPPAIHGSNAVGRERAVRSVPECGKGCRCCP